MVVRFKRSPIKSNTEVSSQDNATLRGKTGFQKEKGRILSERRLFSKEQKKGVGTPSEREEMQQRLKDAASKRTGKKEEVRGGRDASFVTPKQPKFLWRSGNQSQSGPLKEAGTT